MAYQSQSSRPGAVAATLAVAALLMAALIDGLSAAREAAHRDTDLAAFTVAPPPPPPPPEPVHPKPTARKRAAPAPAGRRAKPTAIVLPPPIVAPPLPPPPVQVALAPGPGTASHAGTGSAGTGPGAGGRGNGTGGGGDGDGDDTPPRWRHGDLSARDWPRELGPIVREVTVGVRYTVDEHGRVPRCSITRSSGQPLLDQITCDLIVRRFRFDPSRDAQGRPVESQIVETHSWGPERGEQPEGD